MIPHRRTSVAASIACLSALLLAGCFSQPTYEHPDVVWQNGEPTGPLEDNPWVQAAVRASDLEMATAGATLDFSSEALYATTAGGHVARYRSAMDTSAQKEEWSYPPGPTPMIPIHVEESPSGNSANVTLCRARGWLVSAEAAEHTDDPNGGLVKEEVTRNGEEFIVDQGPGLTAEIAMKQFGADAIEPFLDDRPDRVCSLKGAAIGLFDPQPDVNYEYGPEDFRLPDQGNSR